MTTRLNTNKDFRDGYDKGRVDAEKEYMLNTYGLTIKIADAEKQRVRADAIEEFWTEFDKQIKSKGKQTHFYTEFLRIGMEIKEQLKE